MDLQSSPFTLSIVHAIVHLSLIYHFASSCLFPSSFPLYLSHCLLFSFHHESLSVCVEFSKVDRLSSDCGVIILHHKSCSAAFCLLGAGRHRPISATVSEAYTRGDSRLQKACQHTKLTFSLFLPHSFTQPLTHPFSFCFCVKIGIYERNSLITGRRKLR